MRRNNGTKMVGHGLLVEFRRIIIRLRRDENVLWIKVMKKHQDGKKTNRRPDQDLRRVEFLNIVGLNQEQPVLDILLKSPGAYQRISIRFKENGLAMSNSLQELNKWVY